MTRNMSNPRICSAAFVLASAWLAGSGAAQSSTGIRHGSSESGSTIRARVPAAASGGPWYANGGWGYWGPPYYVMATPEGIFTYVPPMIGPGPLAPTPGVFPRRGPIAPPPPMELVAAPKPEVEPQRPRPRDPARSDQLLAVGDRLFRAGQWKKAEERYLQAAKAYPLRAAPYVRLAQLAFVRRRYVEAANHFRDAQIAEPGWLVGARDIQGLYGEPGQFTDHLARLESYLHAHPEDRDGWLVLGAQWYLSGRATRAADVFLRLRDPRRKPDVALQAFLSAANLSPDADDTTAASSRGRTTFESP